MHVVFGVTGRVGGETARALIDGGELVRVVVRRAEQGIAWQARGVQVAIADLQDPRTLAAALKGADPAFLLNPTPASGDPFVHTEKVCRALTEALDRINLPRAVALSSIGAQHGSGTGIITTLNRFEAALDGTVPALTFLRSGYFIETWEDVADTAAGQRILPTFITPDRKIAMVSTVDVGRSAAQLLTEGWSGRRVVELSGPEDYAASQVAAAFAAALGHPVDPAYTPTYDVNSVLAAAGVPVELAGALQGMYEGIETGHFQRQDSSEQWRGKTLLSTAIERMISNVR